MANTYFGVLDERCDGGEFTARYRAGAQTAGPWDPGAQHGGPPNALAVRAAERAAGPDGLVAARLASEFVGPVPLGDLDVHAHVVRAARSAVLVRVSVSSAGRECLHSRVWLVRERDTGAAIREAGTAGASGSAVAPPPLPGHLASSSDWDFPYAHSIEWRPVGAARTDSPGRAVWARPRLALVEDEPLTALQRVALIGDSASGISSVLDWDRWSFLNVDLDIHLARATSDEWIHLAAATQLGPAGFALCRGTASDRRGPVAATAQTLLLAPRTP